MPAQQPTSAEIIPFPARGRFAPGYQEAVAATPSLSSARAARVAVGGAWYHDEAIRVAADERKN